MGERVLLFFLFLNKQFDQTIVFHKLFGFRGYRPGFSLEGPAEERSCGLGVGVDVVLGRVVLEG